MWNRQEVCLAPCICAQVGSSQMTGRTGRAGIYREGDNMPGRNNTCKGPVGRESLTALKK
jgi:hypothetical protein